MYNYNLSSHRKMYLETQTTKHNDKGYSLGTVIKQLRIEAQLTQKELAEKLNTITQHVQKWEYDIIKPNTKNLKRLLQACHYYDNELFNQIVCMYYL